jgi:hypothetical protein
MSEQIFEIGLVGAGAISAGAYTGGVIDFMVQALDEWYEAKAKRQPVPPHDVRLSVFSGASAGAITAALATGYLGSDQPAITTETDGSENKGKNKLFDSWVDRIDISSLLEGRDLVTKESLVISLLDSSVLTEIAQHGLDVTPRMTRRPYVADNFELLLTVTNLRGVPYGFKLLGGKPSNYDMSLHADYVHFQISDLKGGQISDRYQMTWKEFDDRVACPIKDKLKLSALASGAFPIGLAPRTLNHTIAKESDWYSSREWQVPTPHSKEPHNCVTPKAIPAAWETIKPEGFDYTFQCVDGGVMNNEPFELARRVLAGTARNNDRNGVAAKKAMLLIDPFPSVSLFDPEYAPAPDLLKTAIALFNALKNQARFKPEELLLAADEDVYSRFMIAPTRGGKRHAIACGALGGFGGFLKREFRAHDYFLGRRNAQKFFRDHFVLPEQNSLFSEWDEDLKRSYCVKGHANVRLKDNEQRLLPIIPLVGKAMEQCYEPEWPQYTVEDLGRLAEQVASRTDMVKNRLVDQYFKNNWPLVRFLARWILGKKQDDVVEFIRQKVTSELRKMELMR